MLAISGQGADSHRGFSEKNGFTATMLSDAGLKVASSYDATMNLGLIKLVNRTVVGIGTNGKIVYYQRGTPSTDAILAAVAPAPV